MAKPKPKPPTPKPKKYTWVLGPGGVNCYESTKGGQTVSRLWEADESSFHDAQLAGATRQINSILERLEKGNEDPERRLSFIEVESQPFLVWSRYEAIGPDGDPDTIRKALRLKAEAEPWWESSELSAETKTAAPTSDD